MRQVLVAALLLVGGCSKREAKPDPAVVEDVIPPAVDEAIAPAKPDVGAPVAREAALPPRTACQATCEHSAGDCNRIEGTIFVEGEWNNHIGCYPRAVQVDCCAALPVEDVAGIAKALGWATATPAQRVAIGWFIARVVQNHSIQTEVPEVFGTVPAFTPPVASSQQPVVLDFWWYGNSVRRTVLLHTKLTFGEDGAPTSESLGEVVATRDPQVERQRAIDQAREAGLLPTDAK